MCTGEQCIVQVGNGIKEQKECYLVSSLTCLSAFDLMHLASQPCCSPGLMIDSYSLSVQKKGCQSS